MSGERLRPLLLIAGLLVAACGVPIAAEDAPSTPQVAAAVTQLTESGASARSADSAPPAAQASSAALALTPQPSLTALPGSNAVSALTEAATATPQATAGTTLTPTAFGTPPAPPTPTPSTADFATRAFNLINKYRAEYGRAPLRLDARLNAAAASYAKLMADTSWFTCGCDPHTGPDRSEPETRFAAAGYLGRFRGEALNGGQGSPEDSVIIWLNSPRHAAILLDPAAADVGIGYYYKPGDIYGHYWVLDTGIP